MFIGCDPCQFVNGSLRKAVEANDQALVPGQPVTLGRDEVDEDRIGHRCAYQRQSHPGRDFSKVKPDGSNMPPVIDGGGKIRICVRKAGKTAHIDMHHAIAVKKGLEPAHRYPRGKPLPFDYHPGRDFPAGTARYRSAAKPSETAFSRTCVTQKFKASSMMAKSIAKNGNATRANSTAVAPSRLRRKMTQQTPARPPRPGHTRLRSIITQGSSMRLVLSSIVQSQIQAHRQSPLRSRQPRQRIARRMLRDHNGEWSGVPQKAYI